MAQLDSLARDLTALAMAARTGDYDDALQAAVALARWDARTSGIPQVIASLRAMAGAARDSTLSADMEAA